MDLKIKLVAYTSDLYDAWMKRCDRFNFVQVMKGDILSIQTDAVVSPSNSAGFMDGGIDDKYTKFFGERLEKYLQKTIREEHDGELLVGNAVVVPTGHQNIPYMISAPTMRVPMKLPSDTVNPYLATRAAVLCVLRLNKVLGQYHGDPKSKGIQTLSFPGMGTGVGQIPAEMCAHQMAAAFEETLTNSSFPPYSWGDAVYRHEQLLNW
jgi:O-acetyl-ADP-ribose deacetylase (regulator of RNase III)